MRGFSARNLWRMMQFYETYRGQPKLSLLVTELSWTHNLLILTSCKRQEEREFYLRLAVREKWSKRVLERQLAAALFERVILSPAKLSPLLTELHPGAADIFKDTYLIEFLDLPARHNETDLQRSLVAQLKQFLIELGRDFCYVGSQYPIQVGGRDFALDLLFFNRALNCLVAFELEVLESCPTNGHWLTAAVLFPLSTSSLATDHWPLRPDPILFAAQKWVRFFGPISVCFVLSHNAPKIKRKRRSLSSLGRLRPADDGLRDLLVHQFSGPAQE